MCADRLLGILSGPIDGPRPGAPPIPEVEAAPGLAVMHRGSRFRGAVVRLEPDGVVVRSPNTGLERVFSLHPGAFARNGETVTLVRPRSRPAPPPARTASGSIVAASTQARVAIAARILVEGVHDAELVEKVWGDDLRVEGVVVERLDGIDVLPEILNARGPGPASRIGVLVDHLVPGSKESRIAAQVSGPHVLVTGTPFVDVWQAIRPSVLGIVSWPAIPRDRPWKEGMCEFFAEPAPGVLWRRLLSQVKTYADLEPALVGAVESLIDFVTA